MTAAPTAERQFPLAANPDAFRPDPHAGFAEYRSRSALIDLGGSLYATRYADLEKLMTDRRTRQFETETLTFRGVEAGALYDFFAHSMLLSNPPKHAKRRRPGAKTFAYKAIEAWRPKIRALIGELIADARCEGEFDFVERVASPLPSRLIASILGAPQDDAPWFAKQVTEMARGLGSFKTRDFAEIEEAASYLTEYVQKLLRDHRQQPEDDFLSAFLQRVDETGDLSPLEITAQILTIIIGGSDTTRFALTMLVGELLKDRPQWDALAKNSALAANAVQEGLRFEPPIGSMGRVAIEPINIDGVDIPAGTSITLSILSAQRDERVFADSNRFDIMRSDHPRLNASFGFGIHRCLGEALARAELEEAVTALTQKAPDLVIVGDPPRGLGHNGIRGVTPMRVAC